MNIAGLAAVFSRLWLSAGEPSKRPANCIGWSCEKVCPQQIKISEVMRRISATIGM